MEILSTSSTKSSDESNDEDENTTIGDAAKLTNVAIAATTTASSELSSTFLTTENPSIDGSTATSVTKMDASIDDTRIDDQEPSDENGKEPAQEMFNDVTNEPSVTTEAVTESSERIKSDGISGSTIASAIKSNDRSRIVSKDDIESIRGRALNLSSIEHRPSTSGMIFVTAPPALVLPKSSKTFSDDLSDVSMDNEGMDLNSSEHVSATSQLPLIHDSECHSKVCHANISLFFLLLIDQY